MSSRQEETTRSGQAREMERIVEPRVGWVTGTDTQGSLLVDFPGNTLGPVAARTALALDTEATAHAVSQQQGAVLLFENGDPSLPMVMGLLKTPSSTPLTDGILAQPLAHMPLEARVDGRRVVIEGREEVVICCGKASLTLRRDGLVVLRAVNIRTEAEQAHKIKGGKVQIN